MIVLVLAENIKTAGFSSAFGVLELPKCGFWSLVGHKYV
jgi:hypothetical protein